MAERFQPGPEETAEDTQMPDAQPAEQGAASRRLFEFFVQSGDALNEINESASETSDEKKKKKKSRKLTKALFNLLGLRKEEPSEERTEEAAPRETTGAFLFSELFSREADEQQATEASSEELAEVDGDTVVLPAPAETGVSESIEVDIPRSIEVPDQDVPSLPEVEDLPFPDIGEELDPLEDLDLTEEARELELADSLDESGGVATERAPGFIPPSETSRESLDTPKESEPKRKGLAPALVSFLGANWVSGRRDRKVKEQLRGEAAELHQKQEKAHNALERKQQELEKKHRAQQQAAEQMRARQEEQSLRFETIEELVQTPEFVPSKPQEALHKTIEQQGRTSMPERAANAKEAQSAETRRSTPEQRRDNTAAETRHDPEVARRQAEIAAELNLPIEKYNEKRHERKDEPSFHTTVTRTRVGGLSYGGDSTSPQVDITNSLDVPTTSKHVSDDAPVTSPQQSDYQQAIVTGVVTALIILAAIIAMAIIA